MSWLWNSTAAPGDEHYIAEIQRLQHQLDVANRSIDMKVDQLEEAGLDVVRITNKLDEALERIIALQREINALRLRTDTRDSERRIKCTKCGWTAQLPSCEITAREYDEYVEFFATRRNTQ